MENPQIGKKGTTAKNDSDEGDLLRNKTEETLWGFPLWSLLLVLVSLILFFFCLAYIWRYIYGERNRIFNMSDRNSKKSDKYGGKLKSGIDPNYRTNLPENASDSPQEELEESNSKKNEMFASQKGNRLLEDLEEREDDDYLTKIIKKRLRLLRKYKTPIEDESYSWFKSFFDRKIN